MHVRIHQRSSLAFAFAILAAMASTAQVPYATTPSWISLDEPTYSTGAGWADIDRDGWPDLVVANGNDMRRGHLVVYRNNRGTLPMLPDWQSNDIDYHGHLSIGDVNGDGYPDVAVSVFLGENGFVQKGKVKLYLNTAGALGKMPAWTSKDSMYTFSCAFGDADADGDLDLAVACGEAYSRQADAARVYYNRNGMLDSLPGWESLVQGHSLDIGWADLDNNGTLDLVVANERVSNWAFRNHGDSIGVLPSWQSTDNPHSNSLCIGDVNGDGYLDLAVSDNSSIGGTGISKFKVYMNANGTLATTPTWTSAWSGYGSGIAMADVDHDGDLDLLTGGWWNPCRIYLNSGGVFPTVPNWTSATGSVVEAIVCADVDRDGIDTLRLSFTGDGSRTLFPLNPHPLERIESVSVGATVLPVSSYCQDLENGWVSLAAPPSPGTTLEVVALVSRDLDMAVSNWDDNLGNYLFINNAGTTAVTDLRPTGTGFHILDLFPNPAVDQMTLVVSSDRNETLEARTFDILGNEVRRQSYGEIRTGTHRLRLDLTGLPLGIYAVRIVAGDRTASRLLLRTE